MVEYTRKGFDGGATEVVFNLGITLIRLWFLCIKYGWNVDVVTLLSILLL